MDEKRHVLENSQAQMSGSMPSSEAPELEQRVEVLVFLRAVNLASGVAALDQYVNELGPTKPHARRYPSNEELARLYGATNEDLKLIEAFAKAHGLELVQPVHLASRTVTLSGNLGQFAEAFGVSPVQRLDQSGVPYLSYEGKLSVPAELADVVEWVAGLDQQPRLHPHYQRATRGRSMRGVGKETLLLATQVAEAYAFPPAHTGEGQCLGILEIEGGYQPADLDAYFKNVVQIEPPPSSPKDVPANGNVVDSCLIANYEVTQDISIASAMAPGAQIVVYFATMSSDILKMWFDLFKLAIFDEVNEPSVLSISWELPETLFSGQHRKWVDKFNHLFMIAAAKGITICTISGDSGALAFAAPPASSASACGAPPAVNFPSSCPFVLACGGTALQLDDGSIVDEQVWNEYSTFLVISEAGGGKDGATLTFPTNGGASTGGVSALYDLPGYQEQADMPQLLMAKWDISSGPQSTHKSGRGVPDVSSNASFNTGYAMVFDGIPGVASGTSVAGPAWAALTVRLNQALGHRIGFYTPLLYQLQLGEGADVVRTITRGNNGGYEASPERRWNGCTGLGSPNGMALLNALKN